jgi:hypothetical protein
VPGMTPGSRTGRIEAVPGGPRESGHWGPHRQLQAKRAKSVGAGRYVESRVRPPNGLRSSDRRARVAWTPGQRVFRSLSLQSRRASAAVSVREGSRT